MKKNIKEDVESVLLSLHKKIDFLSKMVEALCESTQRCRPPVDKKTSRKDKK
jgi:pyrroloquinoline quinone (PQQ) biosynthesis protein C